MVHITRYSITNPVTETRVGSSIGIIWTVLCNTYEPVYPDIITFTPHRIISRTLVTIRLKRGRSITPELNINVMYNHSDIICVVTANINHTPMVGVIT